MVARDARDAAALCVAGVAQPHIHLCFTWQAWDNLTSTIVSRGRRGTHGTGWRAWTGLVACDARDAAALYVAGVAQPHIHLRFTWQAWHNLTSAIVSRGRRGTHGTGWRAWTGLVARDAAGLCVAGVAQPHIHLHFTWQAWHNLTSTIVSCGRRGTHGTGWRAWTGLVARDARDAAALCMAPLNMLQVDVQLVLICIGDVEASFVRALVAFNDVTLPDDEALQQDNTAISAMRVKRSVDCLLSGTAETSVTHWAKLRSAGPASVVNWMLRGRAGEAHLVVLAHMEEQGEWSVLWHVPVDAHRVEGAARFLMQLYQSEVSAPQTITYYSAWTPMKRLASVVEQTPEETTMAEDGA